MNSGTNGHCTSSIPSWAGIVADERHIFERVGVDGQRAVSCRATHEVVTSIADDEADIVCSGEVNASLDMVPCLGQDDILGKVAEGTLGIPVGGR